MFNKYFKINVDRNLNDYELITLDDRTFLDDCYRHIGCSCIEIVNTLIPDLVLIIDESGKLCDRPIVNPLASMLYGNPYDDIVGVAIVARRSGADLVPLTYDDYKLLVSYLINHPLFP